MRERRWAYILSPRLVRHGRVLGPWLRKGSSGRRGSGVPDKTRMDRGEAGAEGKYKVRLCAYVGEWAENRVRNAALRSRARAAMMTRQLVGGRSSVVRTATHVQSNREAAQSFLASSHPRRTSRAPCVIWLSLNIFSFCRPCPPVLQGRPPL